MTATNNLVQKVGNVVMLTLAVTRSGGDILPNNYAIGRIPTGYRINTVINYFNAEIYKSQYVNERKAVPVEITSDGYIKVGYGITTTGYDSILISVAYPLASS